MPSLTIQYEINVEKYQRPEGYDVLFSLHVPPIASTADVGMHEDCYL